MSEEKETEIISEEAQTQIKQEITKFQNNHQGIGEEVKDYGTKADIKSKKVKITDNLQEIEDNSKNNLESVNTTNNQEDIECCKPEFPANRIKRIIHSNEDIGKIGTLVSGVVSVATELFIKDLVSVTCDNTKENRITINDIKKAIKDKPMYDFISMMEWEE